MSFPLKVGEEYQVFQIKSGTSAKGDWQLIIAREPREKKAGDGKYRGKEKSDITLFAYPPVPELSPGDYYIVDEISQVNLRNSFRQNADGSKTAFHNINCNVRIHKTRDGSLDHFGERDFGEKSFSDDSDSDFGELPF